jgi:hypothetical protein
MSIFHNNKTVVGVFDGDQEAEQAINILSKQGYGLEDSGDHIEVIDQYRFTNSSVSPDEVLAVPPPLGANNPPGMVVTSDNPQNPGEMEGMVKRELTDKGLEEDEAAYFARHVARGGVLVVLETTAERAEQASAIVDRISMQPSRS